jgi:hypothetical protein
MGFNPVTNHIPELSEGDHNECRNKLTLYTIPGMIRVLVVYTRSIRALVVLEIDTDIVVYYEVIK